MIFMMSGLTPGWLWSMSKNLSLVCPHLEFIHFPANFLCVLGREDSKAFLTTLCLYSLPGTSGSAIQLTANFFRILSRPQCALFQYHVDFKPQMEARRLRFALLFQHGEILGSARSFDGAQLILPHRLPNKVHCYYSQYIPV